MMGGNRHKETAQRAPSNSKNTWPENYIHLVQTISTKKKNMLCILCAVASMCLATVYIMGFVVIIFIIVLKVIKVNAYQRILIILDYED